MASEHDCVLEAALFGGDRRARHAARRVVGREELGVERPRQHRDLLQVEIAREQPVEAEQRGYERHFDAPIAELNPAVLEFQKLTIRMWEEYLAERDAQPRQRRLPVMPSAPHDS